MPVCSNRIRLVLVVVALSLDSYCVYFWLSVEAEAPGGIVAVRQRGLEVDEPDLCRNPAAGVHISDHAALAPESVRLRPPLMRQLHQMHRLGPLQVPVPSSEAVRLDQAVVAAAASSHAAAAAAPLRLSCAAAAAAAAELTHTIAAAAPYGADIVLVDNIQIVHIGEHDEKSCSRSAWSCSCTQLL